MRPWPPLPASGSLCCTDSEPFQGRSRCAPPSPPCCGSRRHFPDLLLGKLITGPCSEQHTVRSNGSELRMGTRVGSPDGQCDCITSVVMTYSRLQRTRFLVSIAMCGAAGGQVAEGSAGDVRLHTQPCSLSKQDILVSRNRPYEGTDMCLEKICHLSNRLFFHRLFIS